MSYAVFTPSWAAAVLLAYLLGSLSFAVLVSRLFGLADPRTYGSGNPGATNVLRSGHKGAAALTLAFDALKGWLPVWLALRHWPDPALALWGATAVGLAAFLGHLWPVFFRFEGGKGVATAAGVLLGLSLPLGLSVLGCWLAVAVVLRYSSLAALAAAVAAPVAHFYFLHDAAASAAIALMSALLIWRHQPNIVKLLNGSESKIGSKRSSSS